MCGVIPAVLRCADAHCSCTCFALRRDPCLHSLTCRPSCSLCHHGPYHPSQAPTILPSFPGLILKLCSLLHPAHHCCRRGGSPLTWQPPAILQHSWRRRSGPRSARQTRRQRCVQQNIFQKCYNNLSHFAFETFYFFLKLLYQQAIFPNHTCVHTFPRLTASGCGFPPRGMPRL